MFPCGLLVMEAISSRWGRWAKESILEASVPSSIKKPDCGAADSQISSKQMQTNADPQSPANIQCVIFNFQPISDYGGEKQYLIHR